MPEKRHTWEKEEAEPARWFARFLLYDRLGPQRTLLRAVNEEKAAAGQPAAKGIPGAWSRAAQAWRWRERAEQHDAFQREQERERERAEWEERRKVHVAESIALQAKACAGLEQLDPAELGANDVLRMLIEGMKAERLSRGIPESVEELRQPDAVRIIEVMRPAPEKDEADTDAEPAEEPSEQPSTAPAPEPDAPGPPRSTHGPAAIGPLDEPEGQPMPPPPPANRWERWSR